MAERIVSTSCFPKSQAVTLLNEIDQQFNEACSLAAAGEAYALRMNPDGADSTEFVLFRMLVEKVGGLETLQELRALVDSLPEESSNRREQESRGAATR